MTKQQQRQGFTLIELSIVLVIIGLLVGGVAGMRSYVRNAELTTMMNETKILINAYNQFQTQYNAPPGDYCSSGATCGSSAATTASLAWNGAFNGDGNGLIRAGASLFMLEQYYAFQHLALAGFIQGTYTGAVNNTGGATIGVNVPGAAVAQGAYIFDHPNALDGNVSGDSQYFDGFYGNILRVAGVNAGATTIPDQPLLTGNQAYKVDSKYDDGLANTGNIVSPNYDWINCGNSSGVYYTKDNKTCYLFLKIQ